MADNFFKVKNGLNLPTASADPTITPPAANSVAGDLVFFGGKLYRHNGTAWVVMPGSGTTGLITNADVDAAAGIVDTKLATISTAGKVSGTAITSGDINTSGSLTTSGSITTTGSGNIISGGYVQSSTQVRAYADSAGAALHIRQTGPGLAVLVEDEASPDATVTIVDATGNMGIGVASNTVLSEKLRVDGNVRVVGGDLLFNNATGIENSSASPGILDVGTTVNTATVNIGTGSNTQTVNIGTGAGATTINIGATGDTVVISGTLTTVNTTNLDVADKNITLNKGGLAGSANGSGISIEAAGSSVASITFDQTDGSAQPQNTFTLSGTGSLALPLGTTAQRPNTPSNGMIRYNSSNGAFEGYASGAWSAIGGGAVTDKITQASHAFVVGDVLYMNGGTYAKAKADAANTAEVVGMVSRVVDANNFELTLNGEVSGLTGLTAGENYFLSAATAGAITAVEPSVVGQISLPIGVASSTTTFYVDIKRGVVVGGANLRTQIGLSNNAVTTIQNASAYDAGELAGWVYLNATADQRFYLQAQFAKNAAGTDYNLAYQTTGDTPPAGFSVSITSAGLIQITLPNLAGFVAGGSYVNFALNAPAVGATLPLQIDSASLTNNGIAGVTGAAATAAVTAGSLKVGETSTSQGGFTVYASNAPKSMTSFTLSQPGVYVLIAQSIFGNNSLTGANSSIMGIGTTVDSFAGTVQGLSRLDGVAFQAMTLVHYVNVTSTTTYHLTVQTGATSGNAQNIWGFRYIRLA